MANPDLNIAGLPVQHWISTQREADAMAIEVIEGVHDATHRKPGDVWATLALLLVQWHAANHRPLNAIAVEALSSALKPALESPDVKARLGLPEEVSGGEVPQLLDAAQLDGEADAAGGAKLQRDVLGKALLVSGRTIDAWRRVDKYRSRRDFVAQTVGVIEPPVPRGPDAQASWIKMRNGSR